LSSPVKSSFPDRAGSLPASSPSREGQRPTFNGNGANDSPGRSSEPPLVTSGSQSNSLESTPPPLSPHSSLSSMPQKFKHQVNSRPTAHGLVPKDEQHQASPPLGLSSPTRRSIPNGDLTHSTISTEKFPSSPPLFKPDGLDTLQPGLYRYVPPMADSRHHVSLPPPPRVGSIYTPDSAPSRPASLPHTSVDDYYNSEVAKHFPPPDPPTILAPSPTNERSGSRKPAAHEPFLPCQQSSPDNTYIAVQVLTSEYTLLVHLPGFQQEAITLAMRKRRVLHIVADNWNDSGGGHFERRVSFGYDADLANIRAQFDGETLKIVVPRRILPVIPAGRVANNI